MFISFEGPEGAGKSTQCRRLADNLGGLGRRVLVTREPGGTPFGDEVRRLVLEPNQSVPVGDRAEALLFAAARAQLVDDIIKPALERGDVVICDRYVDSTVAYQGGGRGLPLQAIQQIIDFATGGLMPDLTFLLDLDVAAGLARKGDSRSDRLENEAEQFHNRVRQTYLERASAESERVVVFDARRSVDDLSLDIMGVVVKSLREREHRRVEACPNEPEPVPELRERSS